MDLSADPHATAELHRYAEALLAGLVAGGAPPPPRFADVPGHWLPPAIEALVALLGGEDALAPLNRAAQRDEQRTALFLCLALAVAGHGDRIHASWLGSAFGELSTGRPVSHGQRALWRVAARGAYGPAGKIFVLRRLDAAAVLETVEAETWLRALLPDEPSIVVPPSLVDFPELAQLPELARPAQAAARLSRLLGRCVEITSARQAGGQPPAGGAGPAGEHDEPLTVLRALIGSGGPEGPLNSLAGHLREDLRPGADPHLAAIALHVVTPVVRRAAEDLEQASRLGPPDAVSMPILGHPIVLRPEGPDAETLAAAEQRVMAEGVPVRPGGWIPAGLLTAAVLALVLAVATPAGLPAAAAAALSALAGAVLAWRRHRRHRADSVLVAARVDDLRELAEGAVWALHEYAREADTRARTAAEDLARLSRLLRRGPKAA
jgi:hypothetical protein